MLHVSGYLVSGHMVGSGASSDMRMVPAGVALGVALSGWQPQRPATWSGQSKLFSDTLIFDDTSASCRDTWAHRCVDLAVSTVDVSAVYFPLFTSIGFWESRVDVVDLGFENLEFELSRLTGDDLDAIASYFIQCTECKVLTFAGDESANSRDTDEE